MDDGSNKQFNRLRPGKTFRRNKNNNGVTSIDLRIWGTTMKTLYIANYVDGEEILLPERLRIEMILRSRDYMVEWINRQEKK